jgi:hypothetical protein
VNLQNLKQYSEKEKPRTTPVRLGLSSVERYRNKEPNKFDPDSYRDKNPKPAARR